MVVIAGGADGLEVLTFFCEMLQNVAHWCAASLVQCQVRGLEVALQGHLVKQLRAGVHTKHSTPHQRIFRKVGLGFFSTSRHYLQVFKRLLFVHNHNTSAVMQIPERLYACCAGVGICDIECCMSDEAVHGHACQVFHAKYGVE